MQEKNNSNLLAWETRNEQIVIHVSEHVSDSSPFAEGMNFETAKPIFFLSWNHTATMHLK